MTNQPARAVQMVSGVASSQPIGQVGVEMQLQHSFYWLTARPEPSKRCLPASMYRNRAFNADGDHPVRSAEFVAALDDDGEW